MSKQQETWKESLARVRGELSEQPAPVETQEEIQEESSLNNEIEDILNNEFNEESVVEEVVE